MSTCTIIHGYKGEQKDKHCGFVKDALEHFNNLLCLREGSKTPQKVIKMQGFGVFFSSQLIETWLGVTVVGFYLELIVCCNVGLCFLGFSTNVAFIA